MKGRPREGALTSPNPQPCLRLEVRRHPRELVLQTGAATLTQLSKGSMFMSLLLAQVTTHPPGPYDSLTSGTQACKG